MKKISLLLIIIFFSSICFAGPLFTIKDLVVKIDSPSKDKAINKGQIDGFYILAKKAGYNEKVPENKILNTVEDIEINNEKITGSSYQALMTISYDKERFHEIFKDSSPKENKSIPYVNNDNLTNYPSNEDLEIMILPVIKDKNKLTIFSEDNGWYSSISNLISAKDQKFIIPIGDLDDIRTIDNVDVTNYGKNEIEKLQNKYEANSSLIALALINDGNEKYNVDFSIKRISKSDEDADFINIGKASCEELNECFSSGAKILLNYNDIHNVNKIDENKHGSINTIVSVPVKIISDYDKFENLCKKSKHITAIRLISISENYYKVSIEHTSNDVVLSEDLSKLGIILNNHKISYKETINE